MPSLLSAKNIHIFHPNNELYGSDKVLINILSWLKSKDKNIFLYLPKKTHSEQLSSYIQEHLPNTSIFFTSLPVIRKRDLFLPFLRGLLNIFRVLSKLNSRTDLVYINTSILAPISLVARVYNLHSILHIHEGNLAIPKFSKSFFYMLVERMPNTIVCVSHFIKEELEQFTSNHFKKKAVVIWNGISEKNIKPNPSKENKHSIALIGKITPNKGHLELLKTFQKCSETVQNQFHIHFYGDHNSEDTGYFQELRHMASTFPNLATLHPYQKDMDTVYLETDILVIYSLHEAFPTVALEAMNAGIPLLTTRCGGVEEQLRERETGFFIERNSVKSLERTLTLFIKDSELISTMGNKARKHFLNHYTLQHFYENLNTL
jgi:glycosyltransferase involved in cell wall biosynthesis